MSVTCHVGLATFVCLNRIVFVVPALPSNRSVIPSPNIFNFEPVGKEEKFVFPKVNPEHNYIKDFKYPTK